MSLKAFHGDPAIKEKYLSRVRHHREMDHLIQGTGWENGKGCAVGCTLEAYDHELYETELGIPKWLAKLEDTIFEGLPDNIAMLWPERFLEAIKPGFDCESIKRPFLTYICEYVRDKFDHTEFLDVLPAIDGVILALKTSSDFHAASDAVVWAAEGTKALAYKEFSEKLLSLLECDNEVPL